MSTKAILSDKLDKIAAIIADETISNKGEITLSEKCAVLKTLDAHYATIHKVEPNEDEGGAFAKYRKTISATNSVGTGSSRNADGGRIAPDDGGPDDTISLDASSALELD